MYHIHWLSRFSIRDRYGNRFARLRHQINQAIDFEFVDTALHDVADMWIAYSDVADLGLLVLALLSQA